MTPGRACLAVAAGLVLAAIPFVRYASFAAPAGAHADHAPRYGGQLGMVGDHHIELRRRRGLVEAFVSDSRRRTVRARDGAVVFDGSARAPMVWDGHHLVGPDQPGARELEARVELFDGTRLSLSFAFGQADGATSR